MTSLPNPPTASRRQWLVLSIVSSALFLIVMDMTVLYTALPRLTHDLGVSVWEKLWIVNAYPLVMAGLLPGSGSLGDRFGHRRLFIIGLAVFGVASLSAAFSPAAAILIVCRIVLAIGAAMMMPATLSIIRLAFPDEKQRSFAIGVWAAVASGGAALGPVVGGVLLEYFSWGSVFLINVPVVAAALILAWLIIPVEPRQTKNTSAWDVLGSLQVLIGLVGVVYALKEFGTRSPSYPIAGASLIVGVVFLILFVRRQRQSSDPLVDFALFKNPRFSSGVGTASIAALALTGMQLVFSQRLQLVLGLSPLRAGLMMLPIPLASFFAGPLAGLAIPRFGTLRVMWISLLICGVDMAAFLMVYKSSLAVQVVVLLILGVGLGAAMTAASNTIMTNAPEEKAGMAASLEAVSYELGGTFGVAIVGTIMTAVYTMSFIMPGDVSLPGSVNLSIDDALIAAQRLAPDSAELLLKAARNAFDRGFVGALATVTGLLLIAGSAVGRLGRRNV